MKQILLEYENLIYPLSDEDYQELKESIQKNGQYTPIVINKDSVILDGHHRYKVCIELGIKPVLVTKEFEDKLHEELFVIDSNLKRRHLNNFQRIELSLKTKSILEKIAKGNMSLGGKGVKDFTPIGRVDKEVGKRAKASHVTVRKVEKIQKKATQEDKEKLRKGEKTINEVHNEIEKKEAVEALLSQPSKIQLPNNVRLIQGDFVQECKQIEDSSIDLIFTDPPYDKKSLHLYEELGSIAHRILKEGGSLITFVGTYDIPNILELVQKSGLKYWWIICVKHTGAHAHMMQKRVFVYWKPMLWFVKGKDIMEGLESLPDFVESKPPDKTLHKWEQSTVEAEHVIRKLTIGENQIVLDPFMGSGTTGIAALHLKRKFIGIEKDSEKFEIAKRRIENESVQTL